MSWKDKTVRDFIRIQEVIHLELNPVKRMAKVLEIATKHKYDDLMQLPMQELRALAKREEWAFNAPDGDSMYRFKFKGRRFEPIVDATRIKAEQFIDGTELSKGTELELIQRLNILMGVITEETTPRWKFWKKRLTDQDKFAMVLDMPVAYVYPNVIFFCRVWATLLEDIPSYLEKMAEELTATAHGMQKDMDGQQP
jgi:hypothetical protein